MALEDILKALEEKAESRIQEAKSDGQQRVNEIIAEVEKDAARTRRIKLKKVEDSIRSECTAIVYSASLKAKNELIKIQENAVNEVFQLAEKRLREIHAKPEYPKILEALLDECLELFEGEVIIEAREDDHAVLQKMLESRNAPYRFSDTPLEASGGLVVSSTDGQVIVQNSFESRLSKARDKLRLDIAGVLFSA